MAKLYFKYGAMNSGKTAILLQAVFNYEQRGMKVLVMKPEYDTKGGKYLVSRVGLKRKIDHLIKKEENIYKTLENKLDDIACIFIDEAQFLSPKQVDELMLLVVNKNIPIITTKIIITIDKIIIILSFFIVYPLILIILLYLYIFLNFSF